jgi:hypothetical protein
MDESLISSIFEMNKAGALVGALGHSGPSHYTIIARCAHSHLIFLLVKFSWRNIAKWQQFVKYLTQIVDTSLSSGYTF